MRVAYRAARAVTRSTAAVADCSPSIPERRRLGVPIERDHPAPGVGQQPATGQAWAWRAVRTRPANRWAEPKPAPTPRTGTAADPCSAALASAVVRGSVPVTATWAAPTAARVARMPAGTFAPSSTSTTAPSRGGFNGSPGQLAEGTAIRAVDHLAVTERRGQRR